MKRIDLNVDIGEGFANDAELLLFATSANVCCGEHAGSWELTLETVALCRERGIRIGAHPGYPDRASMGRAEVESEDWNKVLNSLRAQIMRMANLGACSYVKPHGAFYNEATIPGRAHSSLQTVLRGLHAPLMGLPDTDHETAAHTASVPFIREGFADRAYTPDGRLVHRSRPDALLDNPALVRAQALRLAPRVDSICLHGDSDGCVEFAELVRNALEQSGFEVGW